MKNEKLYNSPYVANRIKNYAKLKSIPLKTVLDDCELGKNTFSHMLHGRSLASDSLAKIADYLDCSVDYLLGRTDFPHLIIEDSKGNKNFVLIEAMTPNRTSDLRLVAAPPVTPAKANQEEDKIDIT